MGIEIEEFHQEGTITIENTAVLGVVHRYDPQMIKGDIGLQVAEDGRIWVCINGIAFIRFSPHPNGKMMPDEQKLSS